MRKASRSCSGSQRLQPDQLLRSRCSKDRRSKLNSKHNLKKKGLPLIRGSSKTSKICYLERRRAVMRWACRIYSRSSIQKPRILTQRHMLTVLALLWIHSLAYWKRKEWPHNRKKMKMQLRRKLLRIRPKQQRKWKQKKQPRKLKRLLLARKLIINKLRQLRKRHQKSPRRLGMNVYEKT